MYVKFTCLSGVPWNSQFFSERNNPKGPSINIVGSSQPFGSPKYLLYCPLKPKLALNPKPWTLWATLGKHGIENAGLQKTRLTSHDLGWAPGRAAAFQLN